MERNKTALKQRRETALNKLEKQLKSGNKPEKGQGKLPFDTISLTEPDKKRINKEIETLKTRV